MKSNVGLVDLALTLESLLGLEPTLGPSGFSSLLRAGPVRDEDGWPERPTTVLFHEATRPRTKERLDVWNNLDFHRAVRVGEDVIESAPVFGEPLLARAMPHQLAELMAALLARWDDRAPGPRVWEAPSAAVESALETLGYLDE